MASPGLASESRESEAQQVARPPAGTGCPFGGPAETTEAVREPVRVKARAQMALGTFVETKVPRPPGRDPAILWLSKVEAGAK
jgi:hypothetical protein